MNFVTRYVKYAAGILFVCIAAAVYFFGHTSNTPAETTVFAFDTYMTFEIYGRNSQKAVYDGEKLIYTIENEMSAYKETSAIYKYNHAKNGEKIKCGSELIGLVKKSVYINNITDGAFDITIYPLCELWDIKNAETPPEEKDINDTLGKIGIDEIEIEGDYLIKHENTMLDLGGIAKGYLSDKLRELMSEYGIKKGIINLGGNVVTIGEKGNNKPWNIGIADPSEPSEVATSVEVNDENVITSGAYQRCFEYNGEKYHHILSPYTGYPAESGLSSVTVYGKDGALCDGLSTAIFILGREKGEQLLKDLKLSGVLITENGEIINITKNKAEGVFAAETQNRRAFVHLLLRK